MPLEFGNIDLTKRPIVKNPDGSISTVRSMSVNMDGREILIPTVSDDGHILSPNEAIELFKKTKKHLGVFSSVEEANSYAQKLHLSQQDMYVPRNPNALNHPVSNSYNSQHTNSQVGNALIDLWKFLGR